MWLAYVLMVAFVLAKPVPYGLAFGFFALLFLFWILMRVVFPPDLKTQKR